MFSIITMKHILRTALIAGLSLSFSACADDLTRVPLDAIADETFWSTEGQLRMAADAIYARVYHKTTVDMEQMGDNTQWYNMNAWRTIGSGLHTTDYSTVRGTWTNAYQAIRESNVFLENYHRASESTPGANERIAAEVKVLRAYFYGILTSLFGDVPLVTHSLSPDEVYGPRTPRAEVVDFILADLRDAGEVLPNAIPSGASIGRIGRGAALGLGARFALYNERWAEAEQFARAVMDMGLYELYDTGDPSDSYRELFTHAGKLANGMNRETIFARLYMTGISTHNLSREIQVPENSRWNATKSLADSYLCADGLPIDRCDAYSDATYADVFENRDPRMTQTLLQPGAVWGGGVDGDPGNPDRNIFTAPKFRADGQGSVTITGYYFTKYVELPEVFRVNQDANDIHLLRYAEVLLTYAEARMELGMLTQGDLDMSINLLRERVGMVPMELTHLAEHGLDLRTEIRRERRVELALEGQRYFDIIRWGEGYRIGEDQKGVKVEWVVVPADVAGRPVDENGFLIAAPGRVFDESRHYLWPVPAEQLSLNPDLGQNPGW